MALVLNFKAIEYVTGTSAKFAKCTFRGFVQQTKPVQAFNETVYYGETLQWPVGRNIDKEESISIRVFSENKISIGKYKPKRLYGTFTMSLQGILEQPHLKCSECLLDQNMQAMDATVAFELHYVPPDGGDLMWDPDEFNYPLLDQWTDSQDQLDGVMKDSPKTIEEMLEEIENEENDNVDPMDILRQIERIHAKGDVEEGDESSSEEEGEEPLTDDFTSLFAKSGEAPSKLDPTLDKMQDFQVSMMLHEARIAAGMRFSISPKVEIVIDGKIETTEIEATEPEEDPVNISIHEARLAKGIRLPIAPHIELRVGDQVQKTAVESSDVSMKDQMRVMIISMKVTKGFSSNLKSYIKLKVDDRDAQTKLVSDSNEPLFNEDGIVAAIMNSRHRPKWLNVQKLVSRKTPKRYFVFDFHTSKAQLFDKVITVTAVAQGRSIPGIRSGQKIGVFKMDIGTVYNAPDHMFFHKWAVLIDPDDLAGGPRGYLKVDIIVTGRGENLKTMPKMVKDYDDDDIDANLLLPVGMSVERQPCEIVVKIHRAEDMPVMYNAVMANVRKAIIGDSPLADPFVKVSFCGMVGKTSVVDGNYNPVWNEQLTFRETFPPLCSRLRFQVFDHDTLSDDVIATHYIDLSTIMHNGDNGGFLPQIGPCYLNLYGAPRGQTLTDKHDIRADLNSGFGEGCAYRGRLLVTIKSDIVDENEDGEAMSAGTWTSPTPPVSQSVCGRKDDFTFFMSLFDASMICEDVVNMKKPVYFEVSIGNFGNTLDMLTWDSEVDAPADQRKKSEAICFSTTPPQMPVTSDNLHYRLAVDEEKPGIYMVFPWEDNRKRMYNSNMLEEMADKFARGMQDVRDSLQRESNIAMRQMKRAYKKLRDTIQQYLVYSRSVSGGAVKTKLDKDRNRLCEMSMDRIASNCKKLSKQLSEENIRQQLKDSKSIITTMRQLSKEPQHSVADVIIWMICNKKRIAYVRIPAREIIYSSSEMEKGRNCGKMRTLFLRQPGKMGMNQMGWKIQGKILCYMWLGIDRGRKDYMVDLPGGFIPVNKAVDDKSEQEALPPTALIFKDKARFHLQAYLYQARALIGSDETGLSDPFARVICYDRSVTTRIVYETLSPAWDQHMSIEDITIYMSHEEITKNPPMVFIEMFDWDKIGKPEFLGRAICTPRLCYLDEEYSTPALQWWDVYRGQSKAGELLAAFELVEVGPDGELPEGCSPSPLAPYLAAMREKMAQGRLFVKGKDPSLIEEKDIPPLMIQIPRGIRPAVSRYRLEVLFWGVREMQRLRLSSVNRPQVIIECSGTLIKSTIIKSAKDRPNFDNPVMFADVDLPENPLFWPPFMIRVIDCRSFGRTLTAGIHVVSYTQKFQIEGVKGGAGDGLSGSTVLPGGSVIDWQVQNGVVVSQPGSKRPSRAASLMGGTPTLQVIDETGTPRSLAPSRRSSQRSVMNGSPGAAGTPTSLAPIDEADGDTLSMNYVARTHGAELLPVDAQSMRSGRSRHSVLPDNRSVLSFGQEGYVNPAYQYVDDDRVSQKNELNKSLSGSENQLSDGIGGLAVPGQFGPPGKRAPDQMSVSGVSRKSAMSQKSNKSQGSRKSIVASIKDVILGEKEADPEKGELEDELGEEGDDEEEGEEGEEGEGGEAKPSVPRPTADLNKDNTPNDVEELDWWSRYYCTLEDVTKDIQDVSDDEIGAGGSASDSSSSGGVMDLFSENSDIMDDLQDKMEGKSFFTGLKHGSKYLMNRVTGKKDTGISEIKSEEEMMALKKARRKERAKNMMKALNKIRSGDDDDNLVYEGETKEDNSAIARIKFYRGDLESVPVYGGFKNWLKTFPLYRGKKIDDDEEEDARVSGYFKGSFSIYRVGDSGDDTIPEPKIRDLRLMRSLPSNENAEVMIRLYVIRANDLHPSDPNGKADPYIVLRLGSKVINEKDNYQSKTLNPVFGKAFEIEATFPMDSMLTIQIMDWDMMNKDDLIGQTRIDMENRFYSKHPGASCGIATKYEFYGYNKWRDPMKPTVMLAKMCRESNLPEPSYQPMVCKIGDQFFTGPNQVKDESGEMKFSNEPLALEVIKVWETLPGGCKIVPEHLETRGLYHPEKPGVEQGKLEMWLDIFPKAAAPAWPCVDITPRQPKAYEIRVIVWNTDEVELTDASMLTGELSVDIFIKGWLRGTGVDDQATDIHYNSLTGEGNFNWRFIFPFDYLKCEDKVVIKRKESFYSADETEFKILPKVYIQCWDADIVSSDDYIGSLALHLSSMPRGVKSAGKCGLQQLKMDGTVPLVSIFKNRNMKGWWPFVAMDPGSGEMEMKGKVELELSLLSKEEAENSPVGLGREEPDALPMPNRPKMSFAWFGNPWIVFKNIIWKNYKWMIIKGICCLLYILFLALFIYTSPSMITQQAGNIATKIMGLT